MQAYAATTDGTGRYRKKNRRNIAAAIDGTAKQ